MRFIATLEDITIANGATDSRIVTKDEISDADDLILFAPSAISGGGTPVIQVTYDAVPSAAGNWVTLVTGGADATPPAAGKAKAIADDSHQVPAVTGFRIHGTAAFTAAIAFKAIKAYCA